MFLQLTCSWICKYFHKVVDVSSGLLMFAEEKAKELGLKQVVLCARKGTFLIPWYQRNGYEIYDENPEYSKGNTVAMNKYFE